MSFLVMSSPFSFFFFSFFETTRPDYRSSVSRVGASLEEDTCNIYIYIFSFSLSLSLSLIRCFTGTLNASYIILDRVDLSICTHNHKATSQTWYSDIEWCGEVEGIRYRDERSHTGNLIRLRLVHFNELCGCFSSLCPGWNKFVTDKTWKSSHILWFPNEPEYILCVSGKTNSIDVYIHLYVTVSWIIEYISSSLYIYYIITNSVILYTITCEQFVG